MSETLKGEVKSTHCIKKETMLWNKEMILKRKHFKIRRSSVSLGEAEKELEQGWRREAKQKNRFQNLPRHSSHCLGFLASLFMTWYEQKSKLKPAILSHLNIV